jgi:hypothetical protein
MGFRSYYLVQNLVYGKTRIDFRNNKGHALGHRGGGHKKLGIIVDYLQAY